MAALLHTTTASPFCHSRSTRPFFSPSYPPSNLSFRSSIPNCSSPSISPVISQRSHPIRLTYLEGNSWLWNMAGLNLLVDPILVGNLDFGFPWLYDAAKKFVKNFKLDDLPELDCLLITQSLNDHCHVKTLKPLSKMCPHLQVVATPNAEPILGSLFSNVTYLEPGQNFEVGGRNGGKVDIIATAGPILGPPWQRPENGYIVSCGPTYLALHYEPHCVYNQSFLQKYKSDIIITPVIKQLLPAFTFRGRLVSDNVKTLPPVTL